jgi:hypothetical protein
MALSGLTSSTNNLVLSGAQLFIDDDTLASGIIGEESMGFAAEFAELYAGQGIKVRVAKKMRTQSISFKGSWFEITPKAINIFYGGTYSSDTGTTSVQYKNVTTAPTAHKFIIKAKTVENKQITITFYNAVNSNFGDVPLDGGDFSHFPFEITPEPVNAGDEDEVLVDITVAD